MPASLKPSQIFRNWIKKDRDRTPAARNLRIRHLVHDNDDWLEPSFQPHTHLQFDYQPDPFSRSPSKSPQSSSNVAPKRPPRPPSLYRPTADRISLSSYSVEDSDEDTVVSKPKRPLPQLDGVWECFLKDTNEDPSSFQYDSELLHGDVQSSKIQETGRDCTLRRRFCKKINTTRSTPDLLPSLSSKKHRRRSTEDLTTPIVLYSTSSPPSPNYSSSESTPLATPTSTFYPLSDPISIDLAENLASLTDDRADVLFSEHTHKDCPSPSSLRTLLPDTEKNTKYAVHWGYAV